MHGGLKMTLYVVLTALACVSGFFFLSGFKSFFAGGPEQTTDATEIMDDTAKNQAGAATATATNATPSAVAGVTNAPGDSAASAEKSGDPSTESIPTARAGRSEGGNTRMMLWAGLFLIAIIGLGFVGGHDISNFFANRTVKVLYNDEGEGMKNPEYENAEQVWADGNHLEAIGLMREYLKKNPREQHVALRIAEIYEKDLHNLLAAALEYEEVLTKKLPAERWGWAAIHLCNLYFKLNKEDKAIALLRRIDAEYGQTAAAEKARKRLAQIDPGYAPSASGESPAGEIEEESAGQILEEQPEEPPAQTGGSDSPLPPGFTLKKKR